MRVYNLSDASPPYKPARKARTLKIKGVEIKPGEYGEVPDNVPTSEFSGLVVSNTVSIDTLPDWYGLAKLEAKRAAKAEPEVQEDPVEEPEPEGMPRPTETSKRSRKRRKS